MREHKFRLIKGGKIVGYEWHTTATGFPGLRIFHSKSGKTGEWFDLCRWPDKYIPHDKKEQSTGLKDKNGKEDWIDDIVETKVGPFVYRRKIFQAESGAFCIRLPALGSTRVEGEAMVLILIEHKNLGNIYENPKLLEKT